MIPATTTSTGRMITPKTAVTPAARTRLQAEEAERLGRSAAAAIRARELIAQARTIRPRSEGRSLADMASVLAEHPDAASPASGDPRRSGATRRPVAH